MFGSAGYSVLAVSTSSLRVPCQVSRRRNSVSRRVCRSLQRLSGLLSGWPLMRRFSTRRNGRPQRSVSVVAGLAAAWSATSGSSSSMWRAAVGRFGLTAAIDRSSESGDVVAA